MFILWEIRFYSICSAYKHKTNRLISYHRK